MPKAGGKVTETFPEHYTIQEGSFWAIKADEATCADVCKKLGIVDGINGLVFHIGDYYGRFDVALWQKLDTWGLG